MKTLLILLGITLSLAANAGFNCKVAKVLDQGNFEKIYEFDFNDNRAVTLDNSTSETHLAIGVLYFNSTDTALQVRGSRSFVTAVATPEGGETFRVTVLKRGTNKGRGFFYYTNATQAETRVAQLKCHQNR
jgi:hypothetical protein